MAWNAAELSKWVKQTVVETDIENNQTIEAILSAPAQAMRAKSFEEVHDAITILAQYGIFIQNQLSKARASLVFYKKEFRERFSIVAPSLGLSAKNKEDRETEAILSDGQLRKIHDKLQENSFKVQRLEGIGWTLTTYHNILVEIYKMKISEKRYGKKS